MVGVGLLLNPRAGQHMRRPAIAAQLRSQLRDGGVVHEAGSEGELREAAEDFKRQGVEVLAIAGGDGTNHITITGLVDVYGSTPLPALALLRGGTMNTVANSLGIPRRGPEALLARTLQSYARRRSEPMRLVQSPVLRVGRHCGFIFGTGAIYGFIREYSKNPRPNPMWAARVLGQAVASSALGGETIRSVARRWRGRVEFDDGSAFPNGDYLTVGASTCGQIGLGFKPFYRSGELPNRFHMLGIHASARSFIRGLPRVWMGTTLGAKRTYEKLARRARLIPEGDVVQYMIDGDVYEHHGPLDVSQGPTLSILVPR